MILTQTFDSLKLFYLRKSFRFVFASVNVGEDCPVFDGMFKFSQISASGSVQVFVFEYMAVKSTKGCHEVE